ncbi:RNA-directed DNA polymerase [Sorangium sp. So ce134]
MRPSPTPTIADLYLAFRQAKTALYFERRGVGLLELAAFEQDLPNNLRALRAKLANQSWFDNVDLGETWIVPKRLRNRDVDGDGVVRIGAPRSRADGRPVDVQLRLSPHPAFAVVEVLYLWRFGGHLDALLSKEEVLGYRIDLRERRVVPHRRWLFEYWPSKYQEFRTAPLAAASHALAHGEQVLIISGDLASFYDTVAPAFLLMDDFVAELRAVDAENFDVGEYRHATSSLLSAYGRYRAEASRRAATTITTGVPIGALTSRLVANVALAPLDRCVSSLPGVLCYRRYVDDIVIVAKAGQEERGLIDILREFLPLRGTSDDVLQLDVDALGRSGSEFQLQKAKIRVHHLAGVPGTDFVDAVASDFAKAVSERRAFIDSATVLGDGATHLVRAGEAEGSPLRVLRDADRARLERFALSTSLHSLERVSSLVDHNQARDLVRRSLERIGRVLDAEDNWVDDLDVSLRLLKLAISTGDWKSASELNERMDRVWGTVDSLRSAATTLYYRGREIDASRGRPWTWLRNYLHARRLEAVSSALPIGMAADQIASRLPGGVVLRTARIGAVALRRRAECLASSDLRARDREEDAQPDVRTSPVDHEWLRAELSADESLQARLATIDDFVKQCEVLGDRSWALPPARLFLCTRPPSYFDIARRWLYRVETDGFAAEVFERLLAIVNAVRGTEYRNPVGSVIDRSTVSIESFWSEEPPDGTSSPIDPRIILGNLVVHDSAWKAAATRVPGSPFGDPSLSVARLQSIARVLDKAARVSHGRSSAVLVLPELSVPRRWFRAVSNHVVRLGRFGLVVGLEYLHDTVHPHVSNQVFAVLPGPFSSVATWPWTKRLPAREEGIQLSKLPSPVNFPPPSSTRPRTVVKSPWGSFSVLICSELIEARRVADLLGRVDVVLCPAWNTDTSSYDHLIQSAGFQLHSIIAIANNGHYSDCRAWAPRSERWERDLCRLIERDVDDVVHVNIPLASLVAFHSGRPVKGWRPLPPDWP